MVLKGYLTFIGIINLYNMCTLIYYFFKYFFNLLKLIKKYSPKQMIMNFDKIINYQVYIEINKCI